MSERKKQVSPKTLISHAIIRFLRYLRIREIRDIKDTSGNARDSNIIVSLTSFGPRLRYVHLAIKSMLDQSLAPKKIILWLDGSPRDLVLPESLLSLVSDRFEIRFGCDNIKGHKKYFYAMEEFPNDIIVTIDDDVVYKNDTLDQLNHYHDLFPNCVIAMRTHRIKANKSFVEPYMNWDYEYKDDDPVPRMSLLATGVGGVLYPAGFSNKDLLDLDLLKKYALDADDIWLKVFETRFGIKTVSVPTRRPHPYQIPKTSISGLSNDIFSFGKNNDLILSNLCNIYGISPSSFMDKD